MAFSALPAAGVLVAIAIFAGVRLEGGDSRSSAAPPPLVRPAVRLDATSDAQARIMRGAARRLAGELSVASRCVAPGFEACAMPALRHAAMSGRTTTSLLHVVLGGVPDGNCRAYLFRLGAASTAAADQARWLLTNLQEDRRYLARQIALGAQMLGRAWRAASPAVCAPVATGPAA